MNTLFSKALADLLDETNIFTRKEWANYLLVSEPAISQWVKGKTMPNPEILKSILLYLENFERGSVQYYVYEFHLMADMPIDKTINVDLYNRYKKFHTITEYISITYKESLDIELMDIDGFYKKELYYLFNSIVRITKEASENCKKYNSKLELVKALQLSNKQIQEWFKEKLIE